MKRFIATFILMSLMSIIAAFMAPQQASATSYRYWTYWWGRPGQAAWQYAPLGPGGDVPGDGWVLGWRYQTTSANGGGAQPPRASASFGDLCPAATPASGMERVAAVVDYGDAQDAPQGQNTPSGRVECTEVPIQSHGSAVMRAAGISLRSLNGFICGIDGYPIVGCATPVAAAPSPTSSPSTSSKPTTTPTPKPSPTPSHSNLPTSPTSSSATPSRAESSATTAATRSASPTMTQSSPGTAIASTGGTPTVTSTTAVVSASNLTSAQPLPATATPAPPATTIASQAAPVSASRNALGLFIGLIGVAILAGSAWFTSRRRGGSR